MKINLVRRSFRLDGGAEASTAAYLRVFQMLGISYALICESWNDELGSHVQRVIKTRGSRSQRSQQFRSAVESLIQRQPEQRFQAHDWIPGAQFVRLGDGLHSSWIRRLMQIRPLMHRFYLPLSAFHRDRMKAEHLTLLHPNLDTVIVNSEFVANEVLERFPSLQMKLHVVRNVLRDDLQLGVKVKSQRKIRLGFAGSGWERKGLARLLAVLPQFPYVTLCVAGRDKHADRYQRMARRHGIYDRIEWLGVVEDMSSFYESIRVLVHPAVYDPSPNVALEAMAFGIPIVTSAQTGISDFKAIPGIFVTDDGCTDLREQIDGALQCSLETRLGLQDFARTFDFIYLADRLAPLYGSEN